MYTFDASSIIHAWDNYPIDNFPPLWDWLGEQIEDGNFKIAKTAFEETSQKSPECGKWLEEKNIPVLPLTNEVLQQARLIKNSLGILEDNYHADGVGEEDLFIIATAKTLGLQLISDEKVQNKLPENILRYKIPAVCSLPDVGVTCINFINLIRASGVAFR